MKATDYTVEKLNKIDARWYGSLEECFIVRFKTFAPIEKIAALDSKGRYASNDKTGYIHGNGNTGTNSMLIKNLEILSIL